ncbi:MAG: cysteine peptidase family C39 domain-containing protein [Abditibacteriales bacterium]|nr:cysteine peptidase family C39 domain-containing protein [Abditibacteriales bacterium]
MLRRSAPHNDTCAPACPGERSEAIPYGGDDFASFLATAALRPLTLLFTLAQPPNHSATHPPDAFLRAAHHPAYRAAMQLAQQKRFRAALKSFEHLAAAPPNAAVGALAQYQIGYCYLALNQPEKARAAFKNFVQLHPHTPLTAPAQAKIRQLTQAQRRGGASLPALWGGASLPAHRGDASLPVRLLTSHPPLRTQSDCGPAALLALCQRLGVKATKEELARLAGTDATGTTMAGLAQAAQAKGLTTEGLWVDAVALQRTRLPALAWASGYHWVAVTFSHGLTGRRRHRSDGQKLPPYSTTLTASARPCLTC